MFNNLFKTNCNIFLRKEYQINIKKKQKRNKEKNGKSKKNKDGDIPNMVFK